MRGADVLQESLFMLKWQEDFVQKAHSLRATRDPLNAALKRMDAGFEVARTLFGEIVGLTERAGVPIILATIPCLR